MAVDIATLGIKIDASGAIPTVEQLGTKLDGLAAKGEKARDAMGRFVKGAGGIGPTVTGLGAPIDGLVNRFSGLGNAVRSASSWFAALGVTIGGAAIFGKMVRESIDAQYAMAQLEARVKSTGMAAGFTAPQLAAMAGEMQGLTTYSDEAVMGAQSLLLTFTKIKGDTLPAATQAVANLATAMGTDLKGAALQVGKALQDPAQGLLALRRSGVSFSEAQQTVIKDLFETGQQAEAQRLILKELEVEFGGAAAAARNTLGGALTGLKNSWGDLFEVSRSSSSGIVGFINAISNALPAFDTKLRAVFGGFRLMWVDLQVGIQKFNAFFYDTIGDIASGSAKLLSYLPGTSDEVRDLTAAADAMHLKAGILRDGMEAWRAEQEALIIGTEQATGAVTRAETATETYTRSAYEQALADARAAKAKKELNDRVEKQISLEERIATLLSGNGPSPKVGGGVSMPTLTTRIGTGSAPIGSGLGANDPTPTPEARARYAAWLANVVALETQLAADRKAIYENFLRGMQESFAKTFLDIFDKGFKGFNDLFSRLGDLIKQAAAQMAASGLMNFLTSNFKAGSAGGGGVLGGLGAIAGAIPGVGWIAGAVAGIAGLFQSHHKAAEAAKRQSEENRRLTIEHQKAADAAAAQAAAERARSEVQQQWNTARAQDDLKVRDLKLRGLTDEAEAQELWNQQVAAFKAAVDEVNRGNLSEDFLKELSAIQERERGALAASQAARKAADAERALTEAREKAAAQAVAFQDLEVELLSAQGRTAEADQRAFELEQQRRLEEAQKNQTAEYVAKLKELQALQTANRTAAMAGGGVTETAASTASNVYAGADTVTASCGARVSAEVGDRMLDNLVSIRVILRSIEANTRNLGSRLNTSLGLSLMDNYALNGSAVVS